MIWFYGKPPNPMTLTWHLVVLEPGNCKSPVIKGFKVATRTLIVFNRSVNTLLKNYEALLRLAFCIFRWLSKSLIVRVKFSFVCLLMFVSNHIKFTMVRNCSFHFISLNLKNSCRRTSTNLALQKLLLMCYNSFVIPSHPLVFSYSIKTPLTISVKMSLHTITCYFCLFVHSFHIYFHSDHFCYFSVVMWSIFCYSIMSSCLLHKKQIIYWQKKYIFSFLTIKKV